MAIKSLKNSSSILAPRKYNSMLAGNAAYSPFWIGLLSSVDSERAEKSVTDANGNFYIVGVATVSASNDIFVAKYNSSGTIQWQKTLGSTTFSQEGYGISIDSSANVYITGYGADGSAIQIAKYNSSGTIQWQRALTGSGTVSGVSIAVDGSGSAYLAGNRTVSAESKMYFAKYNTSGTIQWQTTLGYTPAGSGQDTVRAIASDSSGNTYFTGWDYVGYWTVGKYDTSGTIQWQRRTTNNFNGRGFAIAINSSGTSYSVGAQEGMSIKAYSSAGSLQWWNRLGTTSSWQSASLDTSGNIYVIGTQNNNIQLAKYNSSGTIQWQRTLSSTSIDIGYGISIATDGSIFITGYTEISGTRDILVAKLPADGSKTGTYTVGGYSFTYAASSLSVSSIAPTESANTLSTIAGSMTDAATTLTDATSSLTSTVVSI